MSYKYVHNNVNSELFKSNTVAYYPINSVYFFHRLYNQENMESKDIPDIQLFIGVSLVHPKDQYVKAIGRKEAESCLEWVNFELEHITKLDNCVDYYFNGKHSKARLDLRIRIYNDSKALRVMNLSA